MIGLCRREAFSPTPEPFFSGPRRFRERRLLGAGSGGGWWGWRGSGRCTAGGLGAAGGPSVVIGTQLSAPSGLGEAGRCAAAAERTPSGRSARGWAHGLLREHRHRGRHAAPAGHPQAGPARRG